MSAMLAYRPLPFTVVNTQPVAFTGTSFLPTPDPKEVMLTGSALSVYFTIDLGEPRLVDSFLVGYTSFIDNEYFIVDGGLAGDYEVAIINPQRTLAATSIGAPRRHFFAKAAAPVSVRYLRFTFGKFAGVRSIGIAAVGLAIQPEWNREKGGGRTIIDTGSREALPGGGFGFGEGTVKAGFRWTWGDLSDAELEMLFGLALDRGERKPVVVIEDPDGTVGLNERIHYSLFDRFEHYDRQGSGKHRWSLSVTDWT